MSSKDKKEKEKKEKDKGGKDKGGKDHKKTVSFGAEPEPAHHDHQKKKHEKVSHPEQTLDEKQVKLEGNLAIAAKYCKKLADLGVEYALIGNIAAQFYGAPKGKGPEEIEILISMDTWKKAWKLFQKDADAFEAEVNAGEMRKYKSKKENNLPIILYMHPDFGPEPTPEIKVKAHGIFVIILRELIRLKIKNNADSDQADVVALIKSQKLNAEFGKTYLPEDQLESWNALFEKAK
jgi:hypothetical protein